MGIIKRRGEAPNFYLGLDLSLTGTGLVVLDDSGEVVYSSTAKNKLRGIERLSFIEEVVGDLLVRFKIKMICIEGYAMGSRSGQAFSIGELGGVIKLLLWEQAKTYFLVPPTQLKKYVTGSGRAEKDMVILNVYKKWGWEAGDNNQADAYVLARIARQLHSPSDDLSKYQQEVLDAIINPPKKKGKK